MKKIFIGLIIVILIFATAIVILVNSWSDTGYGKLDYKAAIALKIIELNKDSRSPYEIPADEQRRYFYDSSKQFKGDIPEVAGIKDIKIQGKSGQIPVRIYTPEKDKKLPIIIFFHGGGFIAGNIDTHDNLARHLAKKSSCIVASVDYRLAPENPFPAAIDDAYSALQWIYRNAGNFGGDPLKIAVAGDSAGGNLAAVVSLMSRERSGPVIKYQVLICPVTDLSGLNTESYKNFAEGFFLSKVDIEFLRSKYLPDRKDWRNPYASPLLAKSHKDLPPAIVITAQFDILRDEGEAYAEKLKQAGVTAKLYRYDDMLHDFVLVDRLYDQAHDALDKIAGELKKAFGI